MPSVVSVVATDRAHGYDANGNNTNDGQLVYEWDNTDRLRCVRSVRQTNLLMTCTYDGLSRRREKVEFTDSGVITTRYVYVEEHGAGWLPLLVHVSGPGTNQSLELYTHGPGLSGALGGAGGIGGILHAIPLPGGAGGGYFHCDGNGNVIALTTTNGAVISRLDYAPFGSVLTSPGLTPRFQWSSKEWDAVVGLSYYGFRYYPPTLGRWLNRDPLREQQGSSDLYGFTGNSPGHRIDIDGRFWGAADSGTDLFFGFFGGLGGQVQVTLSGTCCDNEHVLYSYTTIEVCFGLGIGGWGGGVGAPIYQDQWGKQRCPPDTVRTYKKVIGAATGNAPGAPGVIGIGEVGDEGIKAGVGIGAGAGAAVVGCVAFTTSTPAGCCEK